MDTKGVRRSPRKRKASVSQDVGAVSRIRTVAGHIDSGKDIDKGAEAASRGAEPPLKKPLTCLDDLPDELLSTIFENLDNKPLAALCRTKKRYCPIASEILYSNLTNVDNFTRFSIPKPYGTLYPNWKALDSVLQHPALAKYVKCMRCLLHAYEYSPMRQTFATVLEHSTNLRKLEIVEEQDSGDGEERVDLAQRIGWLQTFNNATSPNQSSPISFEKLTELTINTEYLALEELLSVFRIFSLQKLVLTGVYQPEWPMVSPISGSSSNIKELVISGAFLCSEAVAAILDAPKALCKFEFRYSHKCFVPLNSEDDPKAVWARHSYSLIGEALKKHKTSLVYLYLWDKIDLELLQAYINNSGGDIAYQKERLGNMGTLGSLHDFKLQCLEAPLWSLIDVQTGASDLSAILPKQLTHFSTVLHAQHRSAVPLYHQALASLVTFAQRHSMLAVRVLVDPHLDLRDLQLSRMMRALTSEDVLIQVDIGIYPFDVQELEAIERDDDNREPEEEDTGLQPSELEYGSSVDEMM